MSGARQTPILITDEGAHLGTITHIAEALGVSPQQVHAWTERRVNNGCPDPVPGINRRSGGYVSADWYDIDDWRVWHMFYEPSKVRMSARSEDPNRGGAAAVGRLLGVSTKRVCAWIDRRSVNDCPEPGDDGLYDLQEWKGWHATYDPRRSGSNRRRVA